MKELQNGKIQVKERKYQMRYSDWQVLPCSDIQVIYKANTPNNFLKINSSSESYNILKDNWQGVDHFESVRVIYLNKGNKIQGIQVVGTGGVSTAVVDPKIIMQTALLMNSSSIILAHNHPSGLLKPSNADILITNKIKQSCEFLDMTLVDHLIISSEGYMSFADEGIL